MLKIGYLWIVVQLDLNCSNKKFSERNNISSLYAFDHMFLPDFLLSSTDFNNGPASLSFL